MRHILLSTIAVLAIIINQPAFGNVPYQPFTLTPAEKAMYRQDRDVLFYSASGLGAIAPFCVFLGPWGLPCGIVTVEAGVISGAIATYFNSLAEDPIDNNYTVIATPATISLPTDITIGTNLVSDEISLAATQAALLTSINRYQGAVAASNQFWASQQLAAINNYTYQVNLITKSLPNDFSDFSTQLSLLGLSVDITTLDVSNAAQNLLNQGVPQEATNILNNLGLTSSDIQTEIQNIASQDQNIIAGSYPDRLVTFGNEIQTISVPEPGTVFLILTGIINLSRSKAFRATNKIT